MIMKNIYVPAYTQDEIEFIYKELDYLQGLEPQRVFHKKIEEQADKWRNEKQKQANGDTILYSAVHTPSKMFRRAAYLMWAINHFEEARRLDGECEEAVQWLEMIEDILAFRHKDYYNP